MNYEFSVKKISADDNFEFGNIDSEYGVNSLYWTKGGKSFLPVSGEFHFSRYNNNEWKRELLKMKAGGLDFLSTYIFWNHHEYNKGEYDFEGDRDIRKFLSLCKEADMPCILRIGPWAHGECVYGGFPEYVQKLPGKRTNDKKYLGYVRSFWTKLFEETREFYDGKTVVAIQLENEYNGNISHIRTLRKLAEEIGFKAPFFTMTAWPTNTPDRTLMPMFGGYPEAPWAQHKRKLKPGRRFAISKARTEQQIGEDIIGKSVNEKKDFGDFPYGGCEVGTGNEVTQHRRPVIDDKDGYGIAFAKFASGMNWMGYYMYHGGRNPVGRLYQESRRTLYPNNYPIIDYDFQAPLSKDGDKRRSFDRLRLLHYFIKHWDENIAEKQAYFSYAEKPYPYISVRSDEKLCGYVFISDYERGEDRLEDETLDIGIADEKGNKIRIEGVRAEKGSMNFFPFGFSIGKTKADYILAQPITKVNNVWYFCRCDGVDPVISINGEKTLVDKELKIEGITLKILSFEEACELYIYDGKVFFGQDVIYRDEGVLVSEKQTKTSKHGFELSPREKTRLPYGYYLYSYSPRYYYRLKLDKKTIADHFDVVLKFRFKGLNLQLFAGDRLIDDYFNTDGYYILHTRQIERYIGDSEELTIKAVGASFGVGKVYCEREIQKYKADLILEEVATIDKTPLKNC